MALKKEKPDLLGDVSFQKKKIILIKHGDLNDFLLEKVKFSKN